MIRKVIFNPLALKAARRSHDLKVVGSILTGAATLENTRFFSLLPRRRLHILLSVRGVLFHVLG